MSRSWVYELLTRYRTEGDAAFEPRSRRPKTSPTATPPATIDLIITVRKQLAESGLDAGPDTIVWHLRFTHYPLTDGTDTETITRLDDHSRYALHVSARRHLTGQIVLDNFTQTTAQHGCPASVLTDNGFVYTTRFAGRHGGNSRNGLETELHPREQDGTWSGRWPEYWKPDRGRVGQWLALGLLRQ